MENKYTRRAFIVGIPVALVSGGILYGHRKSQLTTPQLSHKVAPRKSKLELANEAYFLGEYEVARRHFLNLAHIQAVGKGEFLHSAALSSYHLGEYQAAAETLKSIEVKTSDDWNLAAFVYTSAGDLENATSAINNIPHDDLIRDAALCKTMALANVNAGNRAGAWQFYRYLQQSDPSSASVNELNETGRFNFSSDFFGHDSTSLLNYTRGFASGTLGWAAASVEGLWGLVRHPIDSVQSMSKAVSTICTEENLKLLLSPKNWSTALGHGAAKIFMTAWESCKSSAAREFNLDIEDFTAQRQIHEIAAGRMIGYVAPDLVLALLTTGFAVASKVAEATRLEKLAATVAQTEERVEKVNEIARSANFMEDLKKYPKLKSIHWLDEKMWEALKNSPKLANRLEQIVDWMGEIKDIPGAKKLIQSIAARNEGTTVEGYLYQLERAAAHARDGKLASIGKTFKVEIALPGKPVLQQLGDADLVLNDGTLVEVKYRSAPLFLEEHLHKQLQKYARAVAEGQFKKIRLECNTKVSPKVWGRCSELANNLGIEIEILENIPTISLPVAV